MSTQTDFSRRTALKTAVAAALIPLCGQALPALASEGHLTSGLNIIQAKRPDNLLAELSAPHFTEALGQAVLSFLQTHYAQGIVPVWKKPLIQTDMHKRVMSIAHHVVQAAIRHATVYPVDPRWIMGQIMAESFFYEFAVSSALAVGPCQFISPTAKGYGLICADSRVVDSALVRKVELEPNFALATQYRQQLAALRRAHQELLKSPEKVLRNCIKAYTAGKPLPDLAQYAQVYDQLTALQNMYAKARDAYRSFLEENFQGRDIENPADQVFLEQFDQRVLHAHAVHAMVKMMAEHLRTLNGNILAATAGYNAGLGNARSDTRIYAAFGRIPNFAETVDYVSKIVVNHYEIAQRMYA
ncbi:hypothetical protein MASR1M90_06000 [Desulfovibrionales bacterium]